MTHVCCAIVVSRRRTEGERVLGIPAARLTRRVVAERTDGHCASGKAWARAVWQRDSAVLRRPQKHTHKDTRQKQQHTQQARTRRTHSVTHSPTHSLTHSLTHTHTDAHPPAHSRVVRRRRRRRQTHTETLTLCVVQARLKPFFLRVFGVAAHSVPLRWKKSTATSSREWGPMTTTLPTSLASECSYMSRCMVQMVGGIACNLAAHAQGTCCKTCAADLSSRSFLPRILLTS